MRCTPQTLCAELFDCYYAHGISLDDLGKDALVGQADEII
jgi:hypothetical protein